MFEAVMKEAFHEADTKDSLGKERKRVHSVAFVAARKEAENAGLSLASLSDIIGAHVSYGMLGSYDALCIIMVTA